MAELWELILSAQDNYKVEDGKPVKGMPALLVKEKEEEIARMNAELQMRARRIQEEQERARQREAERERERERERQREADRERERNLRRMLEERQDVVKRCLPSLISFLPAYCEEFDDAVLSELT
jgi:hypothetical protein